MTVVTAQQEQNSTVEKRTSASTVASTTRKRSRDDDFPSLLHGDRGWSSRSVALSPNHQVILA